MGKDDCWTREANRRKNRQRNDDEIDEGNDSQITSTSSSLCSSIICNPLLLSSSYTYTHTAEIHKDRIPDAIASHKLSWIFSTIFLRMVCLLFDAWRFGCIFCHADCVQGAIHFPGKIHSFIPPLDTSERRAAWMHQIYIGFHFYAFRFKHSISNGWRVKKRIGKNNEFHESCIISDQFPGLTLI